MTKLSKAQKIDLATIIAGGLFFTAGIITKSIWLLLAAYLISGFPVIKEAVYGIFRLQLLDENFLMTLASLAALYCNQYSEAVAVMLFYRVGEFFENYAVSKSRKSIADLMDIAPDTATRLVDGKEETVFPDELMPGDIIVVKPGEKVPVDGTVTEGSTSLNTAALTGESMPQDVGPGDQVISGTINLTGAIKMRTDKAYEDSTVAKVLELVENSASRKASVENFITKFARYYTPAVVGAAVLLALIPSLITGHFHHWVYIAAEFLVISCPCALVISVPLSLFAGIGSSSKQGVLVKGSNYLEALTEAKVVAFDKTGTITLGRFKVSEIAPAHGVTNEELLKYAALGESFSNHPIALSIVKEQGEIDKTGLSDYEEIPGKGIKAMVDGKALYCGNIKLMKSLGVDAEEPEDGGSVVFVALDGRYTGYITVSDVIRPEAEKTISDLYSLGVKETVMLTGDRKAVADKVAAKTGIKTVYADLLPGDKVDTVEKLISDEGRGKLVFVGDGINDAPVLARADVGVAMGAYGSDAAVEAADVVIMTDDLSKLESVMKISRKTLRICKENIVFALGVKFLILAMAPFGLVSMWAAVFADVGVAFIAILNAMRALRF